MTMARAVVAKTQPPQQQQQQQQRRASGGIASVAVKAASVLAGAATKPRKTAATSLSRRPSAPSAAAASAKAAVQDEPASQQERRRRKCRVTVDITSCRYAIIRKCLRERDFRLVKKSTEQSLLPSKWDIWWSDRGDLLRELPRLSPVQKVNHFPSMEEICRKDFLSNNLNAIYKVLPNEFDFFPRSFLVPAESVELRSAMESGPKNATYIVKPRSLCQGKGISLIQSFAKLPPNESCVVQRYIDNPLLIDGLKFDLRIYVLVYSVHPLKIYIFRNGLARFCTTPFEKPTSKNLDKKRMHLTNYAINKKSKSFQQATTANGENQASKRSLASVLKYLDDSGRGSSALVWEQICEIVVKTLLCVEPKLQSSYKSYFGSNDAGEAQWGPKCFEILGFDIMLDAKGKAWLFEVNHAPSFAGDSPLDREVKTALISATLDIVGVTNQKKLQYMRQQRSEWTKRLWTTNRPNPATKAGNSENQGSTSENPLGVFEPVQKEEDPADGDDSGSGSDDVGDEQQGGEVDDDDGDNDVDGGEAEDADRTRGQVQQDKLSLKNVLFRRNRIIPTGGAAVETSTGCVEYGNEYSLLYPIESAGRDTNSVQRYGKVRDAAQVNKSKLWS